jgi:hypothetical protein
LFGYFILDEQNKVSRLKAKKKVAKTINRLATPDYNLQTTGLPRFARNDGEKYSSFKLREKIDALRANIHVPYRASVLICVV